MAITVRRASRKAVPLLMSVTGVSGSGKTYSAILLAAGIAAGVSIASKTGKPGRVCLIDTENGRGEMYADSPGIMRALPEGFDYIRFDPPFTPERYIEHLTAAEASGAVVTVVDSGTHEWEGIGGVSELAEQEESKKGRFGKWASPKMRHKRFVYYCLSSQMHIIFCLRGREKVKMFRPGDRIITSPGQETSDAKVADKDTVVQLGIQPVCEKNFAFEMLVSLVLDEHTHFAAPLKVPEPLLPLFPGKRLIGKDDGERIALWNSTGDALGDFEQVLKRAQVAAEDGVKVYAEFFASLTKQQRQGIRDQHEEFKKRAIAADRERASDIPEVDKFPDAIELPAGTKMRCKGVVKEVFDDGEEYGWRVVE